MLPDCRLNRDITGRLLIQGVAEVLVPGRWVSERRSVHTQTRLPPVSVGLPQPVLAACVPPIGACRMSGSVRIGSEYKPRCCLLSVVVTQRD